MIEQRDNYIFYIYSEDLDCIYNKISSTDGQSLYPDIIFDHSYPESELVDEKAYEVAAKLLSSNLAHRVVFLSRKNSTVTDEIVHKLNRLEGSLSFEVPDIVRETCDKLSADLSLSVTMQRTLLQLLNYYALNGDLNEFIRTLYTRYTIPVTTKNEGKKIYEYIREFILR